MANCALCGAEGTGPRCAVCGTPLTGASFAPTAGAQPAAPTPPSQSFVPSGAYVAPSAPPVPLSQLVPPQRPPSSRTPVIAGVAVLGVLALIVGSQVVAQLTRQATATTNPAGTAPAAGASSSHATQPAQSTQTTQATSTTQAAAASCPEGSTTCAKPLPRSGFVMVLESRIKSSNTLQAARAVADGLASGGNTPRVIDSSLTVGMNPGFWVIGTGPYSTQAAAESSCAAVGRTVGPDCYIREVTQASALADRADMAQIVGECQRANASDLEGCVAVNEFLQRYAQVDNSKSMTRADIANWWKEPGSWYNSDLTLDQLAAQLAKPSAPGTSYGRSTLASIQYGVRDERWVTVTEVKVTLPYTKNGVSGTVVCRYLVTAGTGTNRFRITRVDEP